MNITHYFRVGSWRYYLRHPWEYLADLWQDIRAFFQRGSRGYADCDVWNFDDYLSEVIPSALRYLREVQHGYPGVDGAATEEEWDIVLGKIIRGFEARNEIYDIDTDWDNEILMARLWKEYEEGLALFAKWFGYLWD